MAWTPARRSTKRNATCASETPRRSATSLNARPALLCGEGSEPLPSGL